MIIYDKLSVKDVHDHELVRVMFLAFAFNVPRKHSPDVILSIDDKHVVISALYQHVPQSIRFLTYDIVLLLDHELMLLLKRYYLSARESFLRFPFGVDLLYTG